MSGTPTATMSKSLQARLKKCGRSYRSPAGTRTQSKTADHSNSPRSSDQSEDSTTNINPSNATPKSNYKSSSKSRLTFKTPTSIPKRKHSSESIDNNSPCKNLARDLAAESEECSSKVAETVTDNVCECAESSSDIQNTPKGVKRKRVVLIDPDNVDGSMQGLLARKKHLEQTIAQKEETLRKLKMVKLYREKNDLTHLSRLTTRWRAVCQEGLPRLLELAQPPRPTMTQLIDHLHIEHGMLGYCPDDLTFS